MVKIRDVFQTQVNLGEFQANLIESFIDSCKMLVSYFTQYHSLKKECGVIWI